MPMLGEPHCSDCDVTVYSQSADDIAPAPGTDCQDGNYIIPFTGTDKTGIEFLSFRFLGVVLLPKRAGLSHRILSHARADLSGAEPDP